MITPQLPSGSLIQVERTTNGLKLNWKNPDNPFLRVSISGFLLFWLGGWTVGGIFAMQMLWKSYQESIPFSLFLLFWLGGWAFGEISVIVSLSQILRGPSRSLLSLGYRDIQYIPGRVPLSFFDSNLVQRSQTSNWNLWSNQKPFSAQKQEVQNLQLTNVVQHLRLSFDVGTRRIEIGRYLSEPEKEWLYQVMEKWLHT